MKLISVLLLLVGSVLLPNASRAQTPVTPAASAVEDALRVFVDCNRPGCDFDFFRTEIKFVDYVRDRTDADVHVLVTTQGTGGGGREYTLAFLGQRRFAGRNNTLRYTSRQTESEDDLRRGLARTIKAGLVAYAMETPAGARIEIGYAAPTASAQKTATPTRDRWNFWTFSVGLNGFTNGDDNYDYTNVRFAASATSGPQADVPPSRPPPSRTRTCGFVSRPRLSTAFFRTPRQPGVRSPCNTLRGSTTWITRPGRSSTRPRRCSSTTG